MSDSVAMARYGGPIEYDPVTGQAISFAMEGEDGNFYALGHVNKDRFIEEILNMTPVDFTTVVPSARQIAYGYAVCTSEPDQPFRIAICPKLAEGAAPISRWSHL